MRLKRLGLIPSSKSLMAIYGITLYMVLLVGMCPQWSTVEMQQYIDISPYCGTLGSDTHLSRIDILIHQCINIKTVYLYIQYFVTDVVVVYYGCQFYSSTTI